MDWGARIILGIAAFVVIAVIVIAMLLHFHLGWSRPWAPLPVWLLAVGIAAVIVLGVIFLSKPESYR